MVSQDEIDAGGLLCEHLLESDKYDIYYVFTGKGKAYNLICHECRTLENLLEHLQPTPPDRFALIDKDMKEGLIGQPEVLIRDDPAYRFEHREITLKGLNPDLIVAIQPLKFAHEWIAVQRSGKVIHLNTDTGDTRSLADLMAVLPQMPEDVLLRVSSDGGFCAVTESHGQKGIVLNLNDGTVTMQLDRGEYRFEHTTFPVAFFEHEGKTYIIHSTDWNRLDISDPATGMLLTEREYEETDEDHKSPPHYLDYFHGKLLVSPDNQFVLDDGWVWTPVGVIRIWDLSRWLNDYVWESEDGESRQNVVQRWYFWDAPMCWIDNNRIAVWAFGEDDEWFIPAVTIFDRLQKKRVNWFPGVQKGELYVDTYLFSVGKTDTEVWNIETEARLNRTPDFAPIAYHRTTKEFVTVKADGSLQVSRFVTD